jgi:hypothetical protein
MSQRELGRRYFLSYVDGHEPKVLVQLLEQVFPLYADENPTSCEPALRAWCLRWHLCDQWILDVAMTTLRWWWWLEQNPGSPNHKAGGSGLGWQWGSPHDPVPPSDAPPRGGKRPRGVPAPASATDPWWSEKSDVPVEHAYRHYEWLAVWQLNLHTQDSIAKAFNVSLNTVRTALRETARAIGLTRRERW